MKQVSRYHPLLVTLHWVLAVLITYAISWFTYRIIERPMIGVGKALIHARRTQLAPSLMPPT